MYLGAPLRATAEDYVRRSSADGDNKWSHWKIVLTRARFSDSPFVDVRAGVFPARRLKGRWTWGKKPHIYLEIDLGNLNIPAERRRLRTDDSDGSRKTKRSVVRELRSAIADIRMHAKGVTELGQTIQAGEINVCIILACLRQQV